VELWRQQMGIALGLREAGAPWEQGLCPGHHGSGAQQLARVEQPNTLYLQGKQHHQLKPMVGCWI